MVNKNRIMPVSRVEMAMVPLRPMYFTSTVYQAMIEPGTPTMEVMA